ncbi:MAG TPA: hypothetical protein VJ725_20940 [Thermoanaerobaculia bacterium]|nr:hypothetical protein [Thermoanaerobaculia bacterium]
MTMFFFTFLAAPTPDAQEYPDTGGAYVDCWILGDDRSEAEERARDLIQDYGWSVEALESETTVTSQDYQDDEENREFYEQALVEREVLVFNTWPPGEEDKDEDEEDEEDELA